MALAVILITIMTLVIMIVIIIILIPSRITIKTAVFEGERERRSLEVNDKL